MYILLLAIAIFTINGGSEARNVERYTRNINGGIPDSISNHPYQVALIRDGNLWCSGSILTKFQILTSGNCITDNVEQNLVVHAGSSFWGNPKSVHRVRDYIVYGEETITNLAIMKISPPFLFGPTRQPVKLSPTHYVLQAGKIGVVTGWMVRRSGDVTTQLLSMKAPVLNQEVCSQAYVGTPVGEIVRGQFCAGFNGKEACECDAGNPIIIDGYQVGISFEGFKCGEYKYPTIYTDLTYYHKWIRKHMIHTLEDAIH